MSKHIDAVILWVDGSDEKWQKERDAAWKIFCEKYQIECTKTNSKTRFTSCGELKYCLRGLNAFVPWLRKIYLVTNGQKPVWLKKHRKIKLVTHQEFMDARDLPTFNSSAIEMNLHRIPGLSQTFLYLNDDFFITRNLHRSQLFNSKNQAYYHTYTPLAVSESSYYNSFSWIIRSDQLLLDRLFGEKKRPRPFHQAFIVHKKSYEFLEINARDIMKTTSRQKFRPDSKIGEPSLNIYAVEAIGLELGLYQLKKVDRQDRQFQQYHTPVTIREKMAFVRKNPPIFLCINDLTTREDSKVMEKLMNSLLPNPASWEGGSQPPP